MDHMIPADSRIHKKCDEISSAFFNLCVLHICGTLYNILNMLPIFTRIVINSSTFGFSLLVFVLQSPIFYFSFASLSLLQPIFHGCFLFNIFLKIFYFKKTHLCILVSWYLGIYLTYFPALTNESTTNITNTPKKQYRINSSVTLPVFSSCWSSSICMM
jgi:hypothetical protein